MTRSAFATAALLTGLAILTAQSPAMCQESSLEKSNTILQSLELKRPDYIALIQDVSGSMLTNGMMTKARQAALRVVKEAAVQGTYVRIVGVNATEHVLFDGPIKSSKDRKAALDAIPYKALDGAGTNLRKPHHTALRQALDLGAKAPVIVFVTDSYNDAPRDNPVELKNYAAYYDKGGDLTKIAATPTGKAYRQDISRFAASMGRTFGFGVTIDAESHRPIERSPNDITAPKSEPKPIAPVSVTPPAPDEPIWPYILGGAVIVLAAGAVFALKNRKPIAISIDMGTRSGRDLVFRSGDAVGVGGLVAGCTQTLAFPGNTGAIAILTVERGVLVAKSAASAGQIAKWVLSVNGIDVVGTSAVPVRVGDTLRIRSVAGDTESVAEHRWKVTPVSWGAWKNVIRRLIVLLAVFCVLVAGAFAQGAVLTTQGNQSLPNLYQTGKRYTLRLQYVDPKGDDVTKAIFHDESRSGNIDVPMKAIDGSPADGATVTWEVNGFEKGDHKGYFVVTTETGSTRYPQAPDTFYEFKVHSVVDKWILVGVSIVLCFTLIPWVIYTAVRSMNRRGSPSSAAKVGLMVGALGSLTMFVWQFLGIYDNPLIWILAGVVFIVIVVGVLARR